MNPIQVHADVGGTFTDVIRIDATGRRSLKILSSGLVRCTIAAIDVSDDDSVRITISPPLGDGSEFWVGATVHGLTEAGRRDRLGRVSASGKAWLTLAPEYSSAEIVLGRTIELDAGLEAPVLAIHRLTGVPLSRPLPPCDVRLGTTRGTNALLTRSGAKTALVTTAGFADLLRIDDQTRPDLFDLEIRRPAPLTDRVVQTPARMTPDGDELASPDPDDLREKLTALRRDGVESLAICLMFAHVDDTHERTVERIAREVGFDEISRSSEVAPLLGLLARAQTTVLDAYLNPILAAYTTRVWRQLGGEATARLRLMSSGGNLMHPSAFRGRDSILSGPAGGVVALAAVARSAGLSAAVGLDMGGTSTDVSRFDGVPRRRNESTVAGVRVLTPTMEIETVAAGGGSICDFADGRLMVGPDSAGADPGPACYGRGGPLTVTDVNLLLGRLPADRFPIPLDRDAAAARLAAIRAAMPEGIRPENDESLAEGFLRIAVAHMAEAVRTITTAAGGDVREMGLVGFGGAAGGHLCPVADALDIDVILDHPDAGLMSAMGMGLAPVGRVATRGVYDAIGDIRDDQWRSLHEAIRDRAERELNDEVASDQAAEIRFEYDLRHVGTESPLTIHHSTTEPLPIATLEASFHDLHEQTFGYRRPDLAVECVALRCEATAHPGPGPVTAVSGGGGAAAPEAASIWIDGGQRSIPRFEREDLKPGAEIDGPALVVGEYSTLVIETDWCGTVDAETVIRLTRRPTDATQRGTAAGSAGEIDPIGLEVVARRLQGIADSGGEVLRRTAISVNVKERRDYSCAVFDAGGRLIANAAHVPVHLGAMGHTVRAIADANGVMFPGDCYLSNDPYAGGSHLPDVTAVTPVFCDGSRSDRPDFFVACRAHHAEIGGKSPGSMPPDATCLAEEGVVIRNFPFIRDGRNREQRLRDLFAKGPYPSRGVEENIADIAAQAAANRHTASALVDLATRYSSQRIAGIMARILDQAEDATRRLIETLPDRPLEFSDELDDGTSIAVILRRRVDQLAISFETSPVHRRGFNATPAIVTAAVLYVIRSAAESDLPLCDGALRPIDLRIPVGLLNPPGDEDPARCPAVVAGNVETSNRIVDVLLGALGLAAASQGTMNNVLFGDDSFGYYETIAGGSGATRGHCGVDAVHTHMTNTRITDPEVLERRMPIRLIRFAVRTGSGGTGEFFGGDGVIREYEFLRPLTVSWLTSRRTTSPYGLAGGGTGKPGRNVLDGRELSPTGTATVEAGSRLVIETPGGGGFGRG